MLNLKDSLLIVMGRSRRQVPQKACVGCVIQEDLENKIYWTCSFCRIDSYPLYHSYG